MQNQSNKFTDAIKQALHDVRRPLIALRTIVEDYAKELPKDIHDEYDCACARILDIINELNISASSVDDNISYAVKRPVMVYLELLSILNEKKYEHSKPSIQFINDTKSGNQFTAVNFEIQAFRRAIANIIDNAVAAVSNKDGGKIIINLETKWQIVSINIIDNGDGMPELMQQKILNAIEVHDSKINEDNIGIVQIRDMLKNNDGKLTIESEAKTGTKITISFPRVVPPDWIATEIKLASDAIVVLVNAKQSVHDMWDQRFAIYHDKVVVHHYTSLIEVSEFIDTFTTEECARTYLLIDYKLIATAISDLETINNIHIPQKILLTNFYNDPLIIEAANNTFKILPTMLINAIPIIIADNATSKSVEVVVVDDDKRVTANLKEFMLKDKIVDVYHSAAKFLANYHQYAQDTLILIDYQFTDEEINGVEISRILHEAGFNNYYLYSGANFDDVGLPEDVRVIKKGDIDTLAELLGLKVNTAEILLDVESHDMLVSLALLRLVNEHGTKHFKNAVNIDLQMHGAAKLILIKHNIVVFNKIINHWINNTKEILKNSLNGKIVIKLSNSFKHIVIEILDNGATISENLLAYFNNEANHLCDDNNARVRGFEQIKAAILHFAGSYSVSAVNGQNIIKIEFPIVANPAWLATEIRLSCDDTIVILDEDDAVHIAWDDYLQNTLSAKAAHLKLVHFKQSKEFLDYVNTLSVKARNKICLFTGGVLSQKTLQGLQLVTNIKPKHVILLTNGMGDVDEQNAELVVRFKMLPKELATAIKVSIILRKDKQARNVVDMVWIEDSNWLSSLMIRTHYKHLKVDSYREPQEFLANLDKYPLDTKIILNANYEISPSVAYEKTGYDIARELHRLGYSNLIILSEDSDMNLADVPEYLTVALKNDDVVLGTLDQL